MSKSAYPRGKTYVPDRGPHEGHTVQVQTDDTRVITLPGSTLPPVRHVLVRCLDCLESWTFGQEPHD